MTIRVLAVAVVCASAPAQEWVQRHDSWPAHRVGGVWQSGRGRALLVTSDGVGAADTWEWRGAWIRVGSAGPPARARFTMAYDSARDRVVLFSGSATRADTWEWDGVGWTERFPGRSPPATIDPAMAYDSRRGRTVLFSAGETWEWDGSDWIELDPGTPKPAARIEPAMVYDEARGQVLLYGGWDGYVGRYGQAWGMSDTWAWDGLRWTHVANAPVGRWGHGLAYDPVRERVVMFGGIGFYYVGSPVQPSGTYEWDGASWTRVVPSGQPEPFFRSAHAMFWDGSQIIVAGGAYLSQPYTSTLLPDTWGWDGNAWARRADVAPAGPVALAYDSARRLAITLGVTPLGSVATFEWNGLDWTRNASAGGPADPRGHRMVFDEARGQAVLFGPSGGWLYDGTRWSPDTSTPQPVPRRQPAMAYDSNRQRVVLFDGATWEWDGTQWLQHSPLTSPPATSTAAMAYDPVRRRVVLFGGGPVVAPRDDTWEWDGSNWTLAEPLMRPPGRISHRMAYDAGAGAVVMFGGQTYVVTRGGSSSQVIYDGWFYDGTTWRPTTALPRTLRTFGLAADSTNGSLILHGGHDVSAFRDVSGTWIFSSRAVGSATAVGTGCGGRQVPQLRTFGAPFAGNTVFAIDIARASPGSVGAILLAGRGASLPLLGGCTLLIDPTSLLLAVPIQTSRYGFATLGLPIPRGTGAIGAVLHTQAVVAEDAGPYLGLSFTGSMRLVIGP